MKTEYTRRSAQCETGKMFKQAVILLAMQALVVCTSSLCPDREVCEETHTCCQGPTGEYSCCVHHQGECCNDHLHCCPEHTVCQTEEGKSGCVNATHSLPWTERTPSRQDSLLKSLRVISASPEDKDAVVCPDKSFCPSEFSCVRLPLSYGCCPIAQGIVCADGKHCCPEGLECSTDGKSCIQPQAPVEAVICSDGTSECPQGASCCQSSDGVWGCCPFLKAVCCDDKEHCCPEHSTCDVETSKCISATNQHMPMWAKFPARVRADWENQDRGTDVPCNDTVACQDGSTCCKTTEGEWACCPLPKAVCCEDHVHCCPEGTTCDVTHDTCQSAQGPVPMLTKLPALALPPKPNNVTCDTEHACPDGSTCCKTAEGEWACCPLPEAVCCEDHEHCCPKGTTCDVAHDTCQSAQGPVPMLTKLPALALPPKPNNVTCDSEHYCPDGSTCCKTAEGEWACCPLPEAVCCEDHKHCCPKGTTCDEAHDTCQSAQGPVPMLTKLPALALPPKPNNVTCDTEHSCPDGTTCCKNEQGEWACCPLPEAVCCEDHIHCCPHGTTCNVAAGTCDSADGPASMVTKLPATTTYKMPILPDEFSLTSQCDPSTSCPDRNTCCFMKKEKKWGCCPFPNALCCEDGEHCCPHGYQCDMATTTCTKGDVTIPWYNKMSAQSTPSPNQPVAAATCNASSKCSSDSSCCQLSNGKWGCCPLTEAVCCADQAHCCPKGYTCNLEAGSCQRSVYFQAQMLPLIRMTEQEPEKSTPRLAPEDVAGVQCDELTSCQDDETCCRAEEGWGCCPAPHAICCADKKHCCPAGYTCSVGGTCVQSTRFHKDNWQVFFSKKKRALVY